MSTGEDAQALLAAAQTELWAAERDQDALLAGAKNWSSGQGPVGAVFDMIEAAAAVRARLRTAQQAYDRALAAAKLAQCALPVAVDHVADQIAYWDENTTIPTHHVQHWQADILTVLDAARSWQRLQEGFAVAFGTSFGAEYTLNCTRCNTELMDIGSGTALSDMAVKSVDHRCGQHPSFDALLDGSSLGSPQAVAVRSLTPPEASGRFEQKLQNGTDDPHS